MAYIKEETQHPDFRHIELSVTEREEREPEREHWGIISLDVDDVYDITPDELEHIGVWLIAQAKRIRETYLPTGEPK